VLFLVKLVGSSSPYEGRLEVSRYGVWGTVCDTRFTDEAATLVCRRLGLRQVY